MAKEKTIVIDPEEPLTSKERSEYHVMKKEFPYPEFMDRELMVPALLEVLKATMKTWRLNFNGLAARC